MNWKRIKQSFSRFSEIAPVLSIVIVLVIPQLLSHDPASATILGPEAKAVAVAAENTPYRIGRWVGQDATIPEAAVRLLRPNAMLGRRFVDLDTSQAINFILVHCGDARDMLGHYPPVCYPNSGWVAPTPANVRSDSEGDNQRHLPTVELEINGVPVHARVYEFSRMQDWTTQTSIRIFNFFVLGDGSTTYDFDRVSRRTNRLGASIHGIAQIQLVTFDDVPIEEAIIGSNEILAGVSELFHALGITADE